VTNGVGVDQAAAQVESIAPKIGEYASHIPKSAAVLSTVSSWALVAACYRTVLDPTASDPDTWDDFQVAADAGTALFEAAQHAKGEEITVRVVGERTTTATGPTSNANAGRWLTVVWLAVITRQQHLVERLCAVPVEVLRASGAEHGPFMYPWQEMVRAFLTGGEISPDLVAAAIDGTEDAEPRDHVQLVVYPQIVLLYQVLRRDEDKVNNFLRRAVDAHREYWTSPEQGTSPDGLVALGPLAIAVLARRVGLDVTVESEYLPRNLLTGDRPR
jgi:hypothetical protein